MLTHTIILKWSILLETKSKFPLLNTFDGVPQLDSISFYVNCNYLALPHFEHSPGFFFYLPQVAASASHDLYNFGLQLYFFFVEHPSKSYALGYKCAHKLMLLADPHRRRHEYTGGGGGGGGSPCVVYMSSCTP